MGALQMKKLSNELYYVYVYIDPRNFEEFYYGKGLGSRKNCHLKDDADTEKTRRIRAIKESGLSPIIRVIAANLTEHEAFLIEKTLIWKLGKHLTNKSSGLFSKKFRPHNTLHRHLPGFDFQNGIYYLNVGKGPHRCWSDCRTYGFLSAGQGKRWRDQIQGLNVGDLVAAFVTKAGYVGVGRITVAALPINEFKINGLPLNSNTLACPNIYENSNDLEKSEYVVGVEWIKTVAEEDAYFRRHAGLFAPQRVRASLSNQQTTLSFIEESFGINLEKEVK